MQYLQQKNLMKLSFYIHSLFGLLNLHLWQHTHYYSQSYYGDAIFEIKRYLKTYPKHKDNDYAHFVLAMCYYETIVDDKKRFRTTN